MATQFSGGTYVSTTFTGAVRSDIQSNLRTQLVNAGWTNVAQASGQGPGNVGTVTLTIATPCVVTFASHGFLGGEKVILQVSAGGALPTGLSVNTVYYVKYIDANTFNLAASLGGANINTTGSQSGTITLNTQSMLLQSAAQANVTNPIRVRLKDNGSTCIDISIENQAGSVAGSNSSTGGAHLLPAAAKTFRVLATQYHFMCFVPGASASREFMWAGMYYVDSFITGISDSGFIFCNCISDSDTTIRQSPRTVTWLTDASGGTFGGNFQHIWNANLIDISSASSAGIGCPEPILSVAQGAGTNATGLRTNANYRWVNDDLLTADVLLSIGLGALTDEGKVKGQFFDLIYIAEAFTVDSTDTFNSHDWWNVTNNNTAWPRGGFWMAVS